MNTEVKNRRNKRVLLLFGLVFTLVVLAVTIDFMRKTSRPGSRKHLPQHILEK